MTRDDLRLYRGLRLAVTTTDSRALITTPDEERNHPDEEILKILDGQYVLGAFENGTAVAMATLMRHEGVHRCHVAEVQWVFVLPNHRGKGLAKTIMEATEAYAKNAGIEIIELHVVEDNAPARALYRLLGYQEHGRLPMAVKTGASYMDAFYMMKKL